MGTWSIDPFGNDDAADWTQELLESDGLQAIRTAIETALESEDYLDAPDAAVAIAAVDVLARLLGHPRDEGAYDEGVNAWIEQASEAPTRELRGQAVAALDRVLSGASELKELWEESDEFDQWRGTIEKLRAQVAA